MSRKKIFNILTLLWIGNLHSFSFDSFYQWFFFKGLSVDVIVYLIITLFLIYISLLQKMQNTVGLNP